MGEKNCILNKETQDHYSFHHSYPTHSSSARTTVDIKQVYTRQSCIPQYLSPVQTKLAKKTTKSQTSSRDSNSKKDDELFECLGSGTWVEAMASALEDNIEGVKNIPDKSSLQILDNLTIPLPRPSQPY